MAFDFLFHLGEAKRLAALVSATEAFAVTSVSFKIETVPPAGSPAAAEISGSPFTGTASPASPTQATEVEVYYKHTPDTAGDYKATPYYVVGAETLQAGPIYFTVLPTAGKFDRYIAAASRWLRDSGLGAEQAATSVREWLDAIRVAVREYERWPENGRLLQKDLTLTASDWEYLLTDLMTGASPAAAWANQYSRLLAVEPRVDAAVQSRTYLPPGGWYVDERRAVFGFTGLSPSSGDVARIDFLVRHTLSHTIDTLPDSDHPHFHALCQYAAGEALEAGANRYADTSEPGLGADVAGVRDRQQKHAQQASRMKSEAVKTWRPSRYSL